MPSFTIRNHNILSFSPFGGLICVQYTISASLSTCYAHTPFKIISPIRLILRIPISHQCLHIPSIKVIPNYPHSLTITPVQFPWLLFPFAIINCFGVCICFLSSNIVTTSDPSMLLLDTACIRPAVFRGCVHVHPEDVLVVRRYRDPIWVVKSGYRSRAWDGKQRCDPSVLWYFRNCLGR
jgi:hypothetical protein